MTFVILLFCFISSIASADILEDFDSLGGNKALLEKASALRPEKKIQIVQKRIVNRYKRHEIAPRLEHITSGGNPYFETNSFGLNYHYHINPKWSVSLAYMYFFNKLSLEGKKIITHGREQSQEIIDQDPNSNLKPEPFIPELNWTKQSYHAAINWYPIYGKFSLLNKAIVHFDFYTMLGFGNIDLRYNSSILYNGGIGMGLWWSQHLTSRIEFKYLRYQAVYYDENREINNTLASFSMGYLL